LETCEALGCSPSQFRGRPTLTTYVYDDAGRVLRVVQSSPWTSEDRALMLAWRTYKESLCPSCGHPKATAWHHHSEDSFDLVGEFICWGCTAAHRPDENGKRELVKYPVVEDTRDYAAFPLTGPPELISD
jgi:hypothetical protein